MCAVVCAAPLAHGGSLAPPAGPVSATDRSILSQTVTPPPYTITTSGSYRLTSNLTGAGVVLTITADDVTLDLNGFAVDGAGGPGPAIQVNGRNATIRNGTVRNVGSEGINGVGDGTAVENVTVHDCGRGIVVTNGGRVTGCDVRDTQLDGIFGVLSCTITECTVVRAGIGGGWGIEAIDGSTVVGCVVRDSENGIRGGAASGVDRCAVTSNFSVGILVEAGASARGCTARFNNTGFLVSSASVVDCFAINNFLYGFESPNDGTIDRCSSSETLNSGFWIGDRCIVTNCRSTRDAQGGIGAGIETTGSHSRVTNNTVIEPAVDGFLIQGTQNTLFANVSSAPGPGGAQYTIVGSHDMTPITTASGTVVGNENIAN